MSNVLYVEIMVFYLAYYSFYPSTMFASQLYPPKVDIL